jgi:hypothetical protein
MGISYNTSIVTDGLVFAIDAANPRCYSGSGLTVNGLVSGIGGTLVNGVGFTSSNYGSFFFDGSNDFIRVSNNDLLGSVYTQNIWFKLNNTGSYSLADTSYSGSLIYSSKVEFYYTNISPYYLSANFNFLTNNWYMINLVRGINVKSIYVNGNLIGSVNSSDSYDTPDTTLFIGGNKGGSEFMNGNISQVQIYNRALSQQEIIQNYNATKGRYI